MEHVSKEGQFKRLLAPIEDGTAEVGPYHDHSRQSLSMVDGLDAEDFFGRNSGSNAYQITDSGPLCTETHSYTGDPTRSHSVRAATFDVHQDVESTDHMSTKAPSGNSHLSTEASSGNRHMSTETPCIGSLPQVQSSASKQIYLRDPERDQQEEMEYTEDTTSPKIPHPEGDTDNRGYMYQKGDKIPFLKTITTGGNGPETGHLSGEAVGKMVSAYIQVNNPEVKMMSANHPQGGAAGTMVPAHPQGGTTGTMMPAHPQGGATGTTVPALSQEGATGTMMPAHPQEGASFVKVRNLNVSFPGGGANVLGDRNTVMINKTEIDVEDTGNKCEGYFFNDVCDKKLQLVEGLTSQNETCRVKKDAKTCSDSSHSSATDDIDLDDNCPVLLLDLPDLRMQRCEWPEPIRERLACLVDESENTELESFNDIHSLQRGSGWDENKEDTTDNQIHSTSPLCQSSEFRDPVYESTSSLPSIDSIQSLTGNEGDKLDLHSLEQKNDMLQDLLIPERKSLLSETSQCDVHWNTTNFSMSDSGQSKSEISCGISSELMSDMSHHKRSIDALHKEEMFDSGFSKDNQESIHDDLSSHSYNSNIVYFGSLTSQQLLVTFLDISQSEKKRTYNFNEEINTLDTCFNSPQEFEESGEQISYSLVTKKNESFEDLNTRQMNLSEDCDSTSNSNCDDTVSKICHSDNGSHHIMFYIVHTTTDQKTIITFHDLEVLQDPPGRTLKCTVKSLPCNRQRGEWLLCQLQRLGFLTFHEITPTVVIVEPALHGLGGYFQQMAQGQPVTVLESMRYEWMRVRSFWSFPRNAGVSYLQLARLGFFYTGRVSETCCYSCGQIYREWREGDDPLAIHQQLSPECPHLTGREARNRPIYPDINDQWPAIPWEPYAEGAEGPLVEEEPAVPVGAEASDTEETTTLDARSENPSQETNIAVTTTQGRTSLGDDARFSLGDQRESGSREGRGQEDLSQVVTRPAILDATPHLTAEAPTAGDQTEAGPSSVVEGTSLRQTGGSDRAHPDRTSQEQDPPQGVDPNAQEQGPPQGEDPNALEQQQEPRDQDPQPNDNPPGQEQGRILNPHNQSFDSAPHAAPRVDPEEVVPRGVPRADPQGNYLARYPRYVVQANRADTFLDGWPVYLNQTPYEMSSAGFFYTGNGDYCRCFYCGGGLRNWEPGDDPWVEHARWYPRCLYVRQNKGDRFVRLVQQRQENNRQNAPARQEQVLQPPPANPPHPPVERNQLQGQATPQPNQRAQQPGEPANRHTTTTGQQSQSQQGATASQQNVESTGSTVDEMSLSAVESLKVNGVSSSRIQQALQIWKGQQKKAYKMSDVTSAILMQIIFDQEDEENRRVTGTNPFASSLALSMDAVRGEASGGAGSHFSAITSADSTPQDPEMTEIQTLHNEIEERKKQMMCSICGENEVNVAFLPCGHLVCCFQCAPAMITCPNCREPVKGNVKVFLM